MDDDDTRDLVRRLFALLTAKLEDGAALAVEGQSRDQSAPDQKERANRLLGTGEEIAIIARAIACLTGD